MVSWVDSELDLVKETGGRAEVGWVIMKLKYKVVNVGGGGWR